jgi:hypothetical protein
MDFDLKGSTIKREVMVKKRFSMQSLEYDKVLKDINFLKINRDLENSLLKIS